MGALFISGFTGHNGWLIKSRQNISSPRNVGVLLIDKKLEENLHEVLDAWDGFRHVQALSEKMDLTMYLAGGVLRDVLSQKNPKPKDFDFFIDGNDAETFVASLKEVGKLTTGPFGAARWFPGTGSAVYADLILIKSFYNGLWPCEDILDVLNQFDITVNAIGFNLKSGEFLDPQHGIRDISRRVIRAVRFDYPNEVISENCPLTRLSVLWNRIQHYRHKTTFGIEPITLKWMNDHIEYRKDANAFSSFFLCTDGR